MIIFYQVLQVRPNLTFQNLSDEDGFFLGSDGNLQQFFVDNFQWYKMFL